MMATGEQFPAAFKSRNILLQIQKSKLQRPTLLNPYEQKGPLFKIEDINYGIEDGKLTRTPTPMFCFAVSAKRYALFNIDAYGRPVIRKASAHGLGHLRAPYQESDAPKSTPAPSMPLEKIGVERWQYDLWYQIIVAALDGHPDQVTATAQAMCTTKPTTT